MLMFFETYRLYSYLCRAVRTFSCEHFRGIPANKELFLALEDVPSHQRYACFLIKDVNMQFYCFVCGISLSIWVCFGLASG